MWTFRKASLAAAAVLTLLFIFRVSNSSSAPELRQRLQDQFPYDLKPDFPAYIWQTWKTTPTSSDLDGYLRSSVASWSEKHPGSIHEIITDDAGIHLISRLYDSVPEVVEAYKALPIPILKADFFRYLVLLARGGIYSDIDTEALKPATEWLPDGFDRTTIGLIIGIEADPDRPDWECCYARRVQFCQWTIQAKSGHPVLREIVANITEETLRLKKNGLLKNDELPESIMDFTGPGIWTDTVFSYFNLIFSSTTASNISPPDFFKLTTHKEVGDVVVLPITSFSPGVGHMGAKGADDPMAFVRHGFKGSWKPEDKGM